MLQIYTRKNRETKLINAVDLLYNIIYTNITGIHKNLSEHTFSVMSSEQEASKLPVGSHFMAFTSFWKGLD